MPSIETIPLQPPKHWEDFESLCADIFTYEWNDKNLVKYGRSGQRQNGVDIYGRQDGQGRYSAVQCKGRTTWPPQPLTTASIDCEVEKATKFRPPLAHYYIVTTGPDDKKIQDHVRQITEAHKASNLFEVHALGWEELSRRIRKHAILLDRHYEYLRVGTFGKKIEELCESISRLQMESAETNAAILGIVDTKNRAPSDLLPDQVQECARVFSSISADLIFYPRSLINGASIARPEAEMILNDILNGYSDRKDIHQTTSQATAHLLTGAPGSGKSSLLAELAGTLSSIPDVQLLGLKADLIPKDVRSIHALSHWLRLPLPIIDAIRAIARSKVVVILIDQLDSLASYLDISAGRLITLLNLVRAVADIPNVFTVLSCREFEYKHDIRLNSLRAKQHNLALPEWAAVSSVIENAGGGT